MGGSADRLRGRVVRALGGESRWGAVYPLDADWRRPRGARVGAGVSQGRVAAPVPADRMDTGLVRRVSRLPLLHGGADIAGGGR